jgi:hypothetical protein
MLNIQWQEAQFHLRNPVGANVAKPDIYRHIAEMGEMMKEKRSWIEHSRHGNRTVAVGAMNGYNHGR